MSRKVCRSCKASNGTELLPEYPSGRQPLQLRLLLVTLRYSSQRSRKCPLLTDLNKECGLHPQYDRSVYCGYDNGDFCATKYKSTQSLLKKCSASSSMGRGEFECNDNCKKVVETYVAESGCCVDYWRDHEYYSDEGIDYDYVRRLTVSDVFSACDVDIPEECSVDFNPPKEFLDCARDSSTINRSSTQLASVFVLVSASIGFIAY